MLESKEWFEAPGKVDEEPVVVGRGARGSTLASGIMSTRIKEEAERAKASVNDSIRPPLPDTTTTAVAAVNSVVDADKIVGRTANADADVVAVGTASTNRTSKIDPTYTRAPSLTRKRTGPTDDAGSDKIASANQTDASPVATVTRRNSVSRGMNGWTKLKSRSGEPT